jgi:hypothetical protein
VWGKVLVSLAAESMSEPSSGSADPASTPGTEPLELPAGVRQLCSCCRSHHG